MGGQVEVKEEIADDGFVDNHAGLWIALCVTISFVHRQEPGMVPKEVENRG